MSDFQWFDVLGVHFFSYNKNGEEKHACTLSYAYQMGSKDPRSWGFNVKEEFVSEFSPAYKICEDLKKGQKVRLIFTKGGNNQVYLEDILIKDKV